MAPDPNRASAQGYRVVQEEIIVMDAPDAAFLRSQARKCRQLAEEVSNPATATTLRNMADEFEQQVVDLEDRLSKTEGRED